MLKASACISFRRGKKLKAGIKGQVFIEPSFAFTGSIPLLLGQLWRQSPGLAGICDPVSF
jgi:hypothetical protein